MTTDFGGTTTPDASAVHGGISVRILTPFSPPSDGVVKSVSVYYGPTVGSAKVRPVIYYLDGSTWKLLTYGAEMSKNTDAWNTQTVTDANINTSTSYGIGVWISANEYLGYTNAGGSSTLRRMNTTYSSTDPPTDPFSQVSAISNCQYGMYATYEPSGGAGTNMKININDVFKDVSGLKININDTWKTVAGVKININDSWKAVF